jgi:hypothetical protein
MNHKYAQIELERRWLLASLPDALHSSQDYQLIEDRYLTGTPLRLRRMTNASGQVTARKLTQKYQAIPHPAFALREVTDDPRFTGGELVKLAPNQIQQLLKEMGQLGC